MFKKENIALAYLIFLLLATLVPLGPMNAPLNDNYTLHIRWDYLLHAIVYLALPVFVGIRLKNKHPDESLSTGGGIKFWVLVVLISLSIVILFELVQKVIPYRSFNINDMLANGIGAFIGLSIMILFRKRLGFSILPQS